MSQKRKSRHVKPRAFNDVPSLPQGPEEEMRARRAAFLKSVHDGMLDIADDALASGDIVQIVEVAEEAARQTDGHVSDIFRIADSKRRVEPQLPQVACRAGCCFCCSLTVGVSPFEAIRIRQHLVRSLSDHEIANVQDRIREYAQTKGKVPPKDRVAVMRPCVFLRDQKCSVYEVRPIACRSHHSVDVAACERAVESPRELGVPRFLEVEAGVAPIWTALQDAVRSRQLSGPRLDLPLAVGVFLEGDDVIDRWLQGESVLTSAELP